MTARKALIAAAAAASLMVLGTGSASAQSFLDPADPCLGDPPPAPFSDRASIPEVHVLNVDCAASNGITRGQAGGQFNPGGVVSRGMMASFIARTLVAGGYELPAPADQGFTDIEGSVHKDAINQLAALDITLGVTSDRYVPDEPVRRDQMASFMVRAAEFAYEDDELDGNTTMPFPFTDVPEGNVHRANIHAAEELIGVAQGRTDTLYAPEQSTTRAQMATFVIRLLDVTLIPQP